MHMLSKRDLSSRESETLKRSGSPIPVVTVNGDVQMHEEAKMYVHDLQITVTVQLLEDIPGVLSLRKLCEEHGCRTENVFPVVVPRISSSTTASSSTSLPHNLPVSLDPAHMRSSEWTRETVAKEFRRN